MLYTIYEQIKTGENMAYTPNFSDPRIAKRAKLALTFAVAMLSNDKPRAWSSEYMKKFFGQPQHDLSKYLRNVLLTVTNNHYNMLNGKCKEYIRNQKGVNYLKQALAGEVIVPWENYRDVSKPIPLTQKSVLDDESYDGELVKILLQREYDKELSSGQFCYDDKSNRLWHPIQRIKSEHRDQALNEYGYTYSYDIEACAPTIIEQLSRRYGNDLYMQTYEYYLNNKDAFRSQISVDFDLDIKTTKTFINSLFNGARIGMNSSYATSEILHNDQSRIQLAKEHELICGLREDIKTCWKYIIDSGEEISRRRKQDKNGVMRLLNVTSREKWSVYFKYERYVINAIHQYMNTQNIKNFLIHDGWLCDQELGVDDIQNFVFHQTGFDIKVKLNAVQTTPGLCIQPSTCSPLSLRTVAS